MLNMGLELNYYHNDEKITISKGELLSILEKELPDDLNEKFEKCIVWHPKQNIDRRLGYIDND